MSSVKVTLFDDPTAKICTLKVVSSIMFVTKEIINERKIIDEEKL